VFDLFVLWHGVMTLYSGTIARNCSGEQGVQLPLNYISVPSYGTHWART